MLMLQLKRTIGPKGQIVLPKDIRSHFNLHSGSEVVFDVQEHNIVLKPAVDPKKYVDEFCALGTKVKKMTTAEMKKVIEEQYTGRLAHRT